MRIDTLYLSRVGALSRLFDRDELSRFLSLFRFSFAITSFLACQYKAWWLGAPMGPIAYA